jgi:sec-independent protein translocase protein TatA
MSDPATCRSMLALFSLGGGEVILVLALILILLGAKKLPDIARGLGVGFSEFRRRVGGLAKEFDGEAYGAGESLAGIYGKPAAQALTPDNRTAELYDPAVFHNPGTIKRITFRRLVRFWRLVWRLGSKRMIPGIRALTPWRKWL